MAVMSHITEKIKTLTTDYQDRIKMYRAIESKMIDARNAGKEAAAQHCTADLIVRKAALVELTNKVKELQREHYFVGLEKKRKQGVIRTIQTELDEEKRKAALKKKIEEVIKTKGLAAALDLINLQKEEQQQFASKALNAGSGKTLGGTTGISTAATAASGSGKSLSSKKKKKKRAQRKVNGAKRGKGSAATEDDEDGDAFGEGDDGDGYGDDEDGRGDDPFGDYSTGTMNFGETFSSQQMQQVQGLNVERIDEGDEDEEEDEGEEEEDDDDREDEDDGEGDDEGDGEDEEEEEEGGEEGGPSYFQPPGIVGADAFIAEEAPSPVVPPRREGPVSSAPTPAPASSSSAAVSQSVAKKAAKGPMTADERLSKQHEEELAYMRQLQAELSDPPASQPTTGYAEDVPNSARSSRSKQLSGQKVGYISDEEGDDGEDDEEDDLEVSADASTAPAGSGFQLAKALKMSPRLS